jgi:very-short-patch-repair endonuclease
MARERTPGAIHKSQRAEAVAKRMRRAPTFAEAKLWKLLRTTEPHFRRQAPIGPYIVDFVSHSARLVIELDGGVHELPEVLARDLAREAWLNARGYIVMRFQDEQAISGGETVVQSILARLSAEVLTPHPAD